MLYPLTKNEEDVIVRKETEAPFSGEYCEMFEEGTYVCKRCHTPLFDSSRKFHSNCGWPSYDKALPEAVENIPDPDGIRTEIVCAHCKAHLGHIFKGENYTSENVRHCVNSVSILFIPKE